MAQKGKKTLNIDIPADLFNFYAKACIDAEITKTEGIVRYMKYLRKQPFRSREFLNEDTESNFKLDGRKPK